jgi:hypothetical protein
MESFKNPTEPVQLQHFRADAVGTEFLDQFLPGKRTHKLKCPHYPKIQAEV